MSDLLLYSTGILGFVIAAIHQWAGIAKIVGPLNDIPVTAKRLYYVLFALSTFYWVCISMLLVAAPIFFSDVLRTAVAIAAFVVFLSASVGNYWGTQGKHFGWFLLLIAAIMAVSSIFVGPATT